MSDPRIDKRWRWLWHHIAPEIQTLHLQRLVWQEAQQIITSNDRLPGSYWWEYLGDTYAVTQAVALRRQLEQKKGIISLSRLVLEMAQDPRRLSREFFVSRFGTDENKIAWAEEFLGRVLRRERGRIPRPRYSRRRPRRDGGNLRRHQGVRRQTPGPS